jgi:hypothetical protein
MENSPSIYPLIHNRENLRYYAEHYKDQKSVSYVNSELKSNSVLGPLMEEDGAWNQTNVIFLSGE